MTRIHGGKCDLPGCNYVKKLCGKRQQCHKIPKKPFLRKKWLEFIGSEELKSLSDEEITRKELFLCPEHFLPICFTKRQDGLVKLKSDACPSVKLSEESSNTSSQINVPEDTSERRENIFTNNVITVSIYYFFQFSDFLKFVMY